jgi:hypothetical protein
MAAVGEAGVRWERGSAESASVEDPWPASGPVPLFNMCHVSGACTIHGAHVKEVSGDDVLGVLRRCVGGDGCRDKERRGEALDGGMGVVLDGAGRGGGAGECVGGVGVGDGAVARHIPRPVDEEQGSTEEAGEGEHRGGHCRGGHWLVGGWSENALETRG